VGKVVDFKPLALTVESVNADGDFGFFHVRKLII
jgi:hypothetical protein